MKNLKTFLAITLISILGSCSKSDDKTNPQTTQTGSSTLISENFDDFASLTGKGWTILNKSNPIGIRNWFKPVATNIGFFNAQSGAATDSYIAVDSGSTGNLGTISTWLITPSIGLKNGDVVTFWSRCANGSSPDRLELRLSNAGVLVLPTSESTVGSFSSILTEINPNLAANTYPLVWTKYTTTITGLTGEVNCKLGFRYFVTSGGATAVNSYYIGVDTFDITRN
jgi:hypothetical protein